MSNYQYYCKEYMKSYMRKYNKEKFVCCCGSVVCKSGRNVHLKSKKHQKFSLGLKNQNPDLTLDLS